MAAAALSPCRSAVRHGFFVDVRTKCLARRTLAAGIFPRCFLETNPNVLVQQQRSHASDSASPSKPLASLVPRLDAYELATPLPDIVSVEKGRRIVGIGDIHGDLRACVNFLQVAGLMDPASSATDPIWSGGDTICVQIGDVLDRGNDELACFRLLAILSRQASKQGGALAMLYGNHEPLNTAGVFHYTTARGNQEFENEIGALITYTLQSNLWRVQYAGHEPARWAALEPGGLLAKPLLSKMKVAMVVGRTVFVHAGLTTTHLKHYGSLEAMNKAARDWMLQYYGTECPVDDSLSIDKIIEAGEARAAAISDSMPICLGGGNAGESSPVWMRGYSSPRDAVPNRTEEAQDMIDATLKELGPDVQRMVMGHTPQTQINGTLMGKAWRIDVGASQGIRGGPPEVLEIIHGGDDQEDEVSILTRDGRVDMSEREIKENPSILGSLFGVH